SSDVCSSDLAFHDNIAAHHDLADLADGDRIIVGINDAHLDIGPLDTDRGEDFAPPRMLFIADHCHGEAGNGHRAFALTVNLHKARPERRNRTADVGFIHRPAAIDYDFKVARIRTIESRARDKAMHHRGGKEKAGIWIMGDKTQGFRRIKAAAFGRYLDPSLGDEGKAVKARSVCLR